MILQRAMRRILCRVPTRVVQGKGQVHIKKATKQGCSWSSSDKCFPIANLHYFHSGQKLKGFLGVNIGFAPRLPHSIPDGDGSCKAAEPSHLLGLLENLS